MNSFIIDEGNFDFCADFHKDLDQVEISIGETFNSNYEVQSFFLSREEAKELKDWLIGLGL